MSPTQKRPAVGAKSTPKSAATPVEFSHPEKVSARDAQAPTAPPTLTPFAV